MDKGTHFYRVDFQVHSPRDLEWVGPRPIEYEARMEHARDFVRTCRQKGIQAVAITDHHDICFVKYYQLAAQEDHGALTAITPQLQDPVIFPGIELTLKIPCQVIVLLDADADTTMQTALLTVCALPIHAEDLKTGPKVIRLPFDSLELLDEALSASPTLRGRYIILPHVTHKNGAGHGSLLRDDFYAKYASMSCVGGYIECLWDEHTRKSFLEGKNREWGYKAIGVFQTSDSRRADWSDLGRRTSWVKMAAPTAEALRQACLAHKSRIHHTEPSLPTVYIRRIQVSDSTFLGPIDLYFNRQFNAIIGGRGTGKTSILEYIRYAMQDQPTEDSGNEGDHDEIAKKRMSITQTLQDRDACVTLDWVNNDVPHVVSFTVGAVKPTLQVASAQPVEIAPEELRSILPFQAYSQKQLSTVGTREKELRRFIEQPIHAQLSKCHSAIAEKRHELEQLYDRLMALREKDHTLNSLKTQLNSVQEQAKAAESSLPELPPKLEAALKQHPLRLREKQAIEDMKADLQSAEDSIASQVQVFSGLPTEIDVDASSPQRDLILSIRARVTKAFADARTTLASCAQTLAEAKRTVAADISKWQASHDDHQKLYESAEAGTKEHKQKLDLIRLLRVQEAGLLKQAADLEKEVADLPHVTHLFDEGWQAWVLIHRERGNALEAACRELTAKSGDEIVAELRRGADYTKAIASLKDLLKGCNIRESNWEELTGFLEQEVPANAWMQLMKDLRSLAEMASNDLPADGSMREIPCWASLTPAMRKNIIERCKPSRRWLDVALTSLEDLPTFYYKPSGANRIRFSNASAGQQATALLKVLLKETTGPLVIDQPEDDLDNATIQQIAEELWAAKERRQIIFASHNANIVVNGDAELVVCCDYRTEGDRTMGHLAMEGAIDIPAIRKTIEKVMEGGRKAFQLRRQKYGY